jgi:ribosomal RNA-processing protein 36
MNSDSGSDTYSHADDSQDMSDTQEEELRASLAHVPFEQLVAIQAKTAATRPRPPTDNQLTPASTTTTTPALKKVKRANKNCPMEISSKKPVSRKRQVIEEPKRRHRDPRFDETTQNVNSAHFKQNYAFLDAYRQSEVEALKKELERSKDPEDRRRLKQLLGKYKSEEKLQEQRALKASVRKEWRQQELEKVKQGKRPFYLKRSAQQQLEMERRYATLKEQGQVEKVVERKLKRSAQRDLKRMPQRRRVD